MNRKFAVNLMLTLLVVFGLAPVNGAMAKGSFYYDFERSVKPWTAHSDNLNGYSAERVAGDDACSAMVGNHYLVLKSSYGESAGDRPLPAATWVDAELPIGTESNRVEVRWSAKSVSGCDDCVPIVYIGTQAANGGYSFIPASGDALKSSWQNYKYSVDVEASIGANLAARKLFVALGWMGTEASIGLDCIDISVYPN